MHNKCSGFYLNLWRHLSLCGSCSMWLEKWNEKIIVIFYIKSIFILRSQNQALFPKFTYSKKKDEVKRRKCARLSRLDHRWSFSLPMRPIGFGNSLTGRHAAGLPSSITRLCLFRPDPHCRAHSASLCHPYCARVLAHQSPSRLINNLCCLATRDVHILTAQLFWAASVSITHQRFTIPSCSASSGRCRFTDSPVDSCWHPSCHFQSLVQWFCVLPSPDTYVRPPLRAVS